MIEVRSWLDLEYAVRSGRRMGLDLHRPPTTEPGRPLIVWFHGGGWMQFSKAEWQGVAWLVAEGYAVASVGYRLSVDAKFPAQIEDCEAALAWLQAYGRAYGVDPSTSVLMGHSAGGHLAALLGLSAGRRRWNADGPPAAPPRAIVAMSAPADLTLPLEPAFTGSCKTLREIYELLLGGSLDARIELARDASPLRYVHGGAPPTLLLHGEADTAVPFEEARRLHEALRAAGAEARLKAFPGGTHRYADVEDRDLIRAFLRGAG